jgi:hypothetical protein
MADFTEVDALPSTNTAASLCSSIKKLVQRVKLWANKYADYSAAEGMYEHLNGFPTPYYKSGDFRATLSPGMSANPATDQLAAKRRR